MDGILKVVNAQKLSFMIVLGISFLALCQGCSNNGRVVPTRTPLPTWTSTPANGVGSTGDSQDASPQQNSSGEVASVDSSVAQATATATAAATSTPVPPTATATAAPTDTPLPTFTPQPTALPTATNAPVPTPTPDHAFDLESAEKFPTESLAQNVVRVFLYVYSPVELALADYTIAVEHDGKALAVDAVSTNGLPEQTRGEPSAFTRFTNLNVIFVEPQAGKWSVQLQDLEGKPAGPRADFELTADEITRELYVRYRKR